MSNTERLKALKDRILEHKDRFYYAKWVVPIDDLNGDGTSLLVNNDHSTPVQAHELQHNCNTVGCVGGWAMTFIDVTKRDSCLSDYVKDYLDIFDIEFDFLCFGRSGFGFDCIDTSEATVDDAVARLDFLINNPSIRDYLDEDTSS